MSIRARITLVGLGIVMLVICCLSATLFALVSSGLDTDRDAKLAARADEVVASLAAAARADLTSPPAPLALAPIDPRSSVDTFVMVLAGDGAILAPFLSPELYLASFLRPRLQPKKLL
jgi:hypothetical protein